MFNIMYFIAFVFGFALGSIPFGYILARAFKKIDIREYGSKNIGTTNVTRFCGKPLGIAVFILDASKGFFPAFLSSHYFGINPAIVAGLAAILGHAFTPWLKGKGGKGTATGLGIFMGLAPLPALIAFCAWVIILLVFKWVSVASISASAVLVIIIFISYHLSPIFFFVLLGFLLIVFSHRSNIRRLLRGEEPKIGKK